MEESSFHVHYHDPVTTTHDIFWYLPYTLHQHSAAKHQTGRTLKLLSSLLFHKTCAWKMPGSTSAEPQHWLSNAELCFMWNHIGCGVCHYLLPYAVQHECCFCFSWLCSDNQSLVTGPHNSLCQFAPSPFALRKALSSLCSHPLPCPRGPSCTLGVPGKAEFLSFHFWAV